jgi:hypothetical protein
MLAFLSRALLPLGVQLEVDAAQVADTNNVNWDSWRLRQHVSGVIIRLSLVHK